MPMRDASISSLNCFMGSGLASTGVLVILLMISSYASCCSGPHSNGISFFVRQKIGLAMVE